MGKDRRMERMGKEERDDSRQDGRRVGGREPN